MNIAKTALFVLSPTLYVALGLACLYTVGFDLVMGAVVVVAFTVFTGLTIMFLGERPDIKRRRRMNTIRNLMKD
jgi:ABC-type transport system involved in Fe-S cluster assembly fused permease/ATPase subunit